MKPHFFSVAFCGFGCLLNSCSEDAAIENTVPPNIIWLVAEDASADFFPFYGDTTVTLPQLQALAQEGVVFLNAYAPVPVCAPARSAIITGMYPTTLGTHNMRTYNGYAPENQPGLGIPNYSPVIPDGVRMFPEYLRKAGYYCTNNAKEDYNFRKLQGAWDDSGTKAHWRNRPENSPFFAVFNFGVTHESQIWERGKDPLLVSPETVPVPSYFPNDSTIRHDLAVNYSNLIRLDEQVGEIMMQLKEDGLYENSIIFFYSDHGGPFPRYKRALYETGIKVPLVVKFRENENAGTTDDRFMSFIDLAPTILSLAGVEPPDVMQGKAQFGPYQVQNKSQFIFASADRFDEVYDRLRAVRSGKFKYIRNFNPGRSNAAILAYREQMPMMRKMRELHSADSLDAIQALWFTPQKPEEELYNLEADPRELKNLASDSTFIDTLIRLRKQLDQWIIETNDLGRIPEKELVEKWLPDGQPRQLPPLELVETDSVLQLISDRSDATILWKAPQDSIWRLYMKPIPLGTSFEAKAERIGFRESTVLVYD